MEETEADKKPQNSVQPSTEADGHDGMPRRGHSKLNTGVHLPPRRLREDVKHGSSYVDACCVHTPSTSNKDGTREETQARYPLEGAAEPEIANFEVQAGNTEAICSAHATNLSAEFLQDVQQGEKRPVCGPTKSSSEHATKMADVAYLKVQRSGTAAANSSSGITPSAQDVQGRGITCPPNSPAALPTSPRPMLHSAETAPTTASQNKRDSTRSAATSVFDAESVEIDSDTEDDSQSSFDGEAVDMDNIGGWSEVEEQESLVARFTRDLCPVAAHPD